MWKMYADDNLGIAIQSSVKRLKDAFNKSDDYIRIGQVIYLDTTKEGIGRDWIYNKHFFVKRKSFSAENELRACISKNVKYSGSSEVEFEEYGKYVDVDVDTLIEKIYLAPLSKPYFQKAVKSIMNKYGLEKEIIKSELFSLK
ncbi:DUF2971 domain-containing protein [Nitrosopumilus ureiphilus]|uniref:DUF2971 domain-containing protein n=1 Tax=Nitrosopumilus ureiphilus TaxID=1470067 RepID=A0A7D5M6U8_9ARCH|nr:DUF2971 domain-containing protein [Nitrosopumilus ureiphilus]QLH06010.1 hypothetical protein C5F50_02150 [Nitrosopumilus ureiphilus]